MKVETRYPNGKIKEVWDCCGPDPENSLDGKSSIEASGRCNGCDGEYNEEHLKCYKHGQLFEFRDPAKIGPLPLNQFLSPSALQSKETEK